MRLFGIIGAGGFGREVMPIARTLSDDIKLLEYQQPDQFVFVVEDGQPVRAEPINGHRVLTLSQFLQTDARRFYNIAVGDSRVRERIANKMGDRAEPFTIADPTFAEYDGNEIGEGAIFCRFTHVTSNARIGRFFHCNIYSYVAHDCVIGDFVTFAPNVQCNGNVVIEDHAYIGTGVVIKQGTPDKPLRIGSGAVVGMGAVVTKDVPPGVTVVGNPAAPMQKNAP